MSRKWPVIVQKTCKRFSPPQRISFTVNYVEDPGGGPPAIGKTRCNDSSKCIGTNCMAVGGQVQYWED